MNAHDELFDRYLMNHMTVEERTDFKNRLAQDASFRAEWELHQWLATGLQRRAEKARLSEIVGKSRQKNRKKRIKWGLFGLLLLLVIWSVRLWQIELPSGNPAPATPQNQPAAPDSPLPMANKTAPVVPSPDLKKMAKKEMARYFSQDYPKSRLMTAADHQGDSLFTLAREAFDNENWEETIRRYEAIPGLDQYSDHYDRLGAAYLQAGEAAKAVEVYRILAKKPRVDLQEKAQWYLLLALLANRDREGFEAAIAPILSDKKNRNYARCVALKRTFGTE
ncbi:MAG: hypothetical protein SFV22_02635 [Saprospiraceae bacterium]|nr:hypothetical protein [Saprospiraceae bacterium]